MYIYHDASRIVDVSRRFKWPQTRKHYTGNLDPLNAFLTRQQADKKYY